MARYESNVATTSNTRLGRRFEQRGVVMKPVMNMVRMPFKAGEVISILATKVMIAT